ncbi:hypothetical protein FDJ25_gp080 [Vibrio phage Aphrodite1]|uniref:Uncharacterized protein n=3 Tax=Aphroditevirus TaxID=2560092 RepID=A0A2I7QI71_9CAUD|nr:hypothetical protein FDJ25_gp080 [Vibrio phage Aphrodite1]YP_009847848.1 hypothetical protein HWC35_gp112 [Vibrio phage USC-1]AUR81090.1 hypothetical protein Aphrodite1_0123 [Vibrio phage Aphrodite1]QCW23222.1 hypothetical protein [Vibrio phage 5 TSL-2019]QDH47506.1 hypothetical protein [Vibrio phage USC-1]
MAIELPPTMDQFFTDEYKTMIRSNKEYLLSVAGKYPIQDLSFLHAHRYDFYRVLWESFNVPQHLHWTVAFLNDVENPSQYIGDMKEVLIIEPAVINKLVQRMNLKR